VWVKRIEHRPCAGACASLVVTYTSPWPWRSILGVVFDMDKVPRRHRRETERVLLKILAHLTRKRKVEVPLTLLSFS
jgi:hypothetical protein